MLLHLFNLVSARWGFEWAVQVLQLLIAVLLITVAFLCAWAGYSLGQTSGQIAIERTHTRIAQERETAARQAKDRLQAAQVRGDQLSTTLAQQERQIHQLSREKDDAIRRTTTGRTCLDGPALRVLNGSPGLSVANLPEATSSTAAADEPAASYSSDLDVGRWAIQAGAQYEQCRQRLDALIDWEEETPNED